MTKARTALFTVFLVIPSGFLRALASKTVDLKSEETESEEDSEDDTQGGEQKNKGKKCVWEGGVSYTL